MTDERRRPTADHPLNGPRRPVVGPAFAVLGVIVLVVVLVLVLTWVRNNT